MPAGASPASATSAGPGLKGPFEASASIQSNHSGLPARPGPHLREPRHPRAVLDGLDPEGLADRAAIAREEGADLWSTAPHMRPRRSGLPQGPQLDRPHRQAMDPAWLAEDLDWIALLAEGTRREPLEGGQVRDVVAERVEVAHRAPDAAGMVGITAVLPAARTRPMEEKAARPR